MSPDPTRASRRHRRHGVTLVEALISLAICAALLTAIGSAVIAASSAIQANDEFSKATQAARVILVQMEDQIKLGWLDPTVVTDNAGNCAQFRMIVSAPAGATARSPDRTYKYDAANKRLMLITNTYPADPDFVLARNVSACRFTLSKGADADGNPAVTQVGITLTVTVGKNQVTLAGSAAPRRSLPR